jgi:hypothetical protein
MSKTSPFLVATTLSPPAFAADYVPRVEDLKGIAQLGVSLDKLSTQLADPSQWGAASNSLAQFARDPKFYPNYARNFISKTVKENAEDDMRVGKIKLATSTIISIKDVIDTGTGSKSEVEDVVARCKKAQNLIGDFLGDSGVTDERVVAFVKAHHS